MAIKYERNPTSNGFNNHVMTPIEDKAHPKLIRITMKVI